MFTGRQIKCNLPLSSNTKIFTPLLLMHHISFRSISECLNRFLIVVFKSLNCPQGEKMHLKIIQSLLERVQICKSCWKTEDPAGHGGFFWRTALSLTVQNLFLTFLFNFWVWYSHFVVYFSEKKGSMDNKVNMKLFKSSKCSSCNIT